MKLLDGMTDLNPYTTTSTIDGTGRNNSDVDDVIDLTLDAPIIRHSDKLKKNLRCAALTGEITQQSVCVHIYM